MSMIRTGGNRPWNRIMRPAADFMILLKIDRR